MQPTHSKSTYLDSLTSLRGIAALWVVLFHIDVCIFYRDLGTLIPHELTGLITQGYLWVDFFFILSGFIMAHVYGKRIRNQFTLATIKSYLWARFWRIYPLHLFTLVVLLVLSSVLPAWIPGLVDDSWKTYFDWSALSSQFFLTNAMNQHTYLSWNIVSWSIGAEWWTYFAGIFLLPLLYYRANLISLAVAMVVYSLLATLVYSLESDTLDITYNYGFIRCLLEFTFGIIVYQWYRGRVGQQVLATDWGFASVSLAIVAVFHWGLNDLLIIPLFATLILAASYNKAKTRVILSSPPLQYLGKISYSVYLVHGIWFLVFWYLLPQLTLSDKPLPDLEKLAYVFAFLSMTLICSHFTHHHIEVKGRSFYQYVMTRIRLSNSGAMEAKTNSVTLD